MHKPYSVEEVVGGCPIVLLVQDFDMQERQRSRIAEDEVAREQKNLIGFAIVAGEPTSVFSEGAELFSARGFFEEDASVTRVVRPTPVSPQDLEDGYTVHEQDRFHPDTLLGTILKRDMSFVTIGEDAD